MLQAEETPLLEKTVADLAWELFVEETDNSDRKWTYRHARKKARAAIERIQSGAFKLDRITIEEPAAPEPEPAEPDIRQELTALIDQSFGQAETWMKADPE